MDVSSENSSDQPDVFVVRYSSTVVDFRTQIVEDLIGDLVVLVQ